MAASRAASFSQHTVKRRSLPAPLAMAAIAGACALLAACQTPPPETAAPEAGARVVPDVPITQGRYVVGKPYWENGALYHPAEDWSYNEVGMASWYGINHHGKRTANGETFDLRALTAAHPTLPLPTRVRVTNIENGKSIEVRVNDRGPFVDGRLIDVSERAAEVLGFKEKGTAKVRVEMLGRAPLELFRMAKPQGPAPDLPVRAAPSAQVKAAVLPPPSASSGAAGGSEDGPGETRVASNDGESLPRSPADPVEELINSMASNSGDEAAPAGEQAAAEEPAPAEKKPVSSVDRRFFIQAGAFTIPENAYSLRRLIMKAITGTNVSINPAQVGNREFFRVRVGPFASTEEANGILAQLRNLGQNEAKIISD